MPDSGPRPVEGLAVVLEQEQAVGPGEHAVELERELVDVRAGLELASVRGRVQGRDDGLSPAGQAAAMRSRVGPGRVSSSAATDA